MKFQVTQQNILEGDRQNSECCAVALCMKDKLARSVTVGNTMATVWSLDNERWTDFILPAHVMQFICDFDNGKDVIPIEFDLDIGDLKDNPCT